MGERRPQENRPARHHYVPKFYLSAWHGPDNKLCELSRPYRHTVKPRRVSSSGTGYVDNLYTLRGLSPDLEQQIEERFLKPLDTAASDACAMVRGDAEWAWTDRLRSGWSAFLLSLMVRRPEHIDGFVSYFAHLCRNLNDGDDAEYLKQRKENDPATFSEYIASISPDVFQRHALVNWMNLFDAKGIGQRLNDMHWWVVRLSPSAPVMMTSDRPLVMERGLANPETLVYLPVSPTKVFFAANQPRVRRRVADLGPERLIRHVNEQIVGQAVRYAYDVDDRRLRFAQNRLGSRPVKFPIDQIIGEMG